VERREWPPVDVVGQDRSENGLAWLVGSNHLQSSLRLLHEAPDELRDLIRSGVEAK